MRNIMYCIGALFAPTVGVVGVEDTPNHSSTFGIVTFALFVSLVSGCLSSPVRAERREKESLLKTESIPNLIFSVYFQPMIIITIQNHDPPQAIPPPVVPQLFISIGIHIQKHDASKHSQMMPRIPFLHSSFNVQLTIWQVNEKLFG